MSVDVQGLHFVPLNPALTALNTASRGVVPIKNVHAGLANHDDESVVLVDAHAQAHQSAKEVVRVCVTPVKFHAADVTAARGQGGAA